MSSSRAPHASVHRCSTARSLTHAMAAYACRVLTIKFRKKFLKILSGAHLIIDDFDGLSLFLFGAASLDVAMPEAPSSGVPDQAASAHQT